MHKKIWWRIIRLMLEYSRRIWGIFIPSAIVALGIIVQILIYWFDNKWYQILTLSLLSLIFIISLVIGVIAFKYDFKVTYRKYQRDKHRKGNIKWL